MGEKYNPKNLLLKSQRFVESRTEEKSKWEPEESIAEKLKWRKPEAYDKDLFHLFYWWKFWEK